MTHGVAIPSTQAVSSRHVEPYQGHINCATDSGLAIESERGATENSRNLRRVRVHLPLPRTA